MEKIHKPLSNGPNNLVCPMLTDMYQITMAYAYWKSGKMSDLAVFDLYFRKSPFGGEFTIFAGLEECIRFVHNFNFTDKDIEYLKGQLPSTVEDDFYSFLENVDASQVTLAAIPEGSVVFPKVPLIRIEGPLPVVQLMETTLLNCINYASLVATNAARMRLAAGRDKSLLEFGLRRAQGPDGGLSASRYCYIGGFDGTSNVLAGKVFGIPVKGTHAHAFVSSFSNGEAHSFRIQPADKQHSPKEFYPIVEKWFDKVVPVLGVINSEANKGELLAFTAYATSFPSGFLALVDTYDVLKSGVPNYCAVALALNELGYKSKGIRIDSGDLAYLSVEVRIMFKRVAERFDLPWFGESTIVASNDINEDTLLSLNQQGHEINAFGIGTHLVTCQKQPALGCVFKLVQINEEPRMKLSQDVEKTTVPGKKKAYRLFSHDGHPLVDLLQRMDETPPKPGDRVLCRHPIEATKRAYVSPAEVEELYRTYWKDGQVIQKLPTLEQVRDRTMSSITSLREDYKRCLNPTPYKVSVTDDLYRFMHKLWLENAPIGELS